MTSSDINLIDRLKEESKKSVTILSTDGYFQYSIQCLEIFNKTTLIKRITCKNSIYLVGWVFDNQVDNCMKCDEQFHILKWKHHCRACGFIVCEDCSKSRFFLPEIEDSETCSRVCDDCNDLLCSQLNNDQIDRVDEINQINARFDDSSIDSVVDQEQNDIHTPIKEPLFEDEDNNDITPLSMYSPTNFGNLTPITSHRIKMEAEQNVIWEAEDLSFSSDINNSMTPLSTPVVAL